MLLLKGMHSAKAIPASLRDVADHIDAFLHTCFHSSLKLPDDAEHLRYVSQNRRALYFGGCLVGARPCLATGSSGPHVRFAAGLQTHLFQVSFHLLQEGLLLSVARVCALLKVNLQF